MNNVFLLKSIYDNKFINMDLENILKKIQENIDILKNVRPLSKWELEELRKSLWVMFVHNSNAIEWNSFTLWETKLLLEDWITIWWKTLKEQNEVLNHKELLIMLYNFLEWNENISENLILKIHKEVLKNIDNDNAWTYRKIQNYISWDDQIPPKAEYVESLMKDLIEYYNKNKNTLNIVVLTSNFHYDFAKIHPFIDWNGRTIRILVNMILMKKWFPMIIIPNIRRNEYISNLSSYKTKNDFVLFMSEIINENLKDYLKMIDPKFK